MDWGIALESEDAASSNSCHNDDASDRPPSTPIKMHNASICTPPKTSKSVFQAKTLLARVKLAQRQEISDKRKEFKKWATEAKRAEKMASKAFSSKGRLQQLAQARRKKAEIGDKRKSQQLLYIDKRCRN